MLLMDNGPFITYIVSVGVKTVYVIINKNGTILSNFNVYQDSYIPYDNIILKKKVNTILLKSLKKKVIKKKITKKK